MEWKETLSSILYCGKFEILSTVTLCRTSKWIFSYGTCKKSFFLFLIFSYFLYLKIPYNLDADKKILIVEGKRKKKTCTKWNYELLTKSKQLTYLITLQKQQKKKEEEKEKKEKENGNGKGEWGMGKVKKRRNRKGKKKRWYRMEQPLERDGLKWCRIML